MPKGQPKYCECGCGVTPSNYRKKFFETWATGYPFVDGKYYCSNYGNTNKFGYTCKFVREKCPEAHVDHVFPKALGGRDCINNLRIMCAHCNESKNCDTTNSAIKFKDNKSVGKLKKYHQDNINNAFSIDFPCPWD